MGVEGEFNSKLAATYWELKYIFKNVFVALENTCYLGIKSTKYVQILYPENSQTLMRN